MAFVVINFELVCSDYHFLCRYYFAVIDSDNRPEVDHYLNVEDVDDQLIESYEFSGMSVRYNEATPYVIINLIYSVFF